MRSQYSVIRKNEIRTRSGKISITPTEHDRADRRARGAVPLYSAPATRTASAARTCPNSASSPAPAGRLSPASYPPLCPASAVRASSAPVAAAMAAAMMALAAAARAAAKTPTAARAPTTARAPSSACCQTCKDFVSRTKTRRLRSRGKQAPKRRAVTAKSAALESVQAVIARLEGKVEEDMETRSEDIFHVRDVAPVVVQRRNDQQSCRIFARRGFVEKTSRS
jgi:hypothetical protein